MKNSFKKLSVVLLAGLLAMSLVACSSNGGSTTTTDEGGETTTTTTGAVKDTFTYAIGGEPQYLDPAVASDSVSSYVANQIYYPLFRIGEDGGAVNCAVKDVTVSEDGTVYTFTLDPNNFWSDGQQVVAEDYVFGMKHSVSVGKDDSTYCYFITDFVVNTEKYLDQPVSSMEDFGAVALDETTIEITLKQPCEYFLSLMNAAVFYPLRSDFVPDEGDYTWAESTEVPTNGPFHPVSIDRASEIVMEKNEYFYDAANIPSQRLVCKTMPDMDAELMAFQTGEIDFATAVDASTAYNMYEGKPELEVFNAVINYYWQINTNTTLAQARPELQDVNVRRAISLAIDREAVVVALDAGDVYYPLTGFVPKGFAGVNGDFREEGGDYTTYDPEKAKELLAEAGYADGLEFTYYYNQNAMHDTVAAVIKEQLAEVGINLTLKTGEIRTFFADRSDGLFELARGAMSADYMDTRTFLDMALTSYQATPTWGDSHYDELIAYTDTVSGDERIEALHAAEQYLVEEMVYTIPVFGYKNVCLKNATVTGQVSNPQGNHFFWYASVAE